MKTRKQWNVIQQNKQKSQACKMDGILILLFNESLSGEIKLQDSCHDTPVSIAIVNTGAAI